MGFLSKAAGIVGAAAGFAIGGPAGALVGASIGGGIGQADAASDAAREGRKASEAGISEQRAARDESRALGQPFVDLGTGAATQLKSFLDDPTQQLEEINPLVSFLRDQGFEQIQESAAARGRLGAGGTLKDLTKFNTDLTSTIVPQLQNQRFNQLFNTASVGANTVAGQGTQAINTASNIGNLQQAGGRATAGGITGTSNAITGGIQNVAGAFGAFPDLFGGDIQGVNTTATLPSAANPLGQISPTGQTTVASF